MTTITIKNGNSEIVINEDFIRIKVDEITFDGKKEVN